MPRSKVFDYEQAVARLPQWILALTVIGAVVALVWQGVAVGTAFLMGALAAYFNFRLIERAVNRMTGSKRSGGAGVTLFIQFTALLLAAFVILKSSGFSLAAAFLGFMVCPAAAILEIVYELIAYEHS